MTGETWLNSRGSVLLFASLGSSGRPCSFQEKGGAVGRGMFPCSCGNLGGQKDSCGTGYSTNIAASSEKVSQEMMRTELSCLVT